MFRVLIFFVFLHSFVWANDLAQLTQNVLSRLSYESTPLSLCEVRFSSFRAVSFNSVHSDTEFKIKINPDLSSPQVTSDSTSKTLHIPSLDTLRLPLISEPLRSALNTWLIGHELHPYAGFSSAKPSQKIALGASYKALAENSSSLLHIAPTGMGKTYVLVQTLMKQIAEFSDNNKKIFILTVDRIQLIEQLFSQLKQGEYSKNFHITDWRAFLDKSWQSFASEIKLALKRDRPTVLLISSQSLKKRLKEFFAQTELEYKNIQNMLLSHLGGIYIDEAHHLGAYQTKSAILDLLEESREYQGGKGEVFLYGTTATPVHHAVHLRDFFEREHWTYLNTEENLFEKHNVESVLEQLALGIDKGELTPFDDLYIVGEDNFKDISREESSVSIKPVFIQSKKNSVYEINPDHYESLLRIMGPLLSSNKKGFIVTATIEEAERLQEFLNQRVKDIKFEAYHSQMDLLERREVLDRSKLSDDPHYIIAVRALDEGVDLPHLSTYIDINLNVSIHQMIHRIGRVLRISPGKTRADILFLINHKDERFAKNALSVLEKLENLSFSGGYERKSNEESQLKFEGSDVKPMSREELEQMRDRLQESIQKFWLERYRLEEVPEAVERLNEDSPDSEQIIDTKTYKEFRHKDPKLPHWSTLGNWYKKEHGSTRGLVDFVLSRARIIPYTLEETPEAIRKLNEKSPDSEQIIDIKTYREFRHKDPKLPPWSTLGQWYRKEHGSARGPVDFVLSRARIIPYTLEETPEAIRKLNEKSPDSEQIIDIKTYREFRHKDPKLPPWSTLGNWYKKEHGSTRGLFDWVFKM